jgi:Cu2+-exporting ATPase
VTGSLLIDYDPFHLAEETLLEQLATMTENLQPGAAPAAHKKPSRETLEPGSASFLRLLATSAVLASTGLPVPGPVLAGLVLATDLPVLGRAVGALRRRRLDGNVLEMSALLLVLARGDYVASALLSWLRSLGEFIVSTSVVRTRRSLHDLVAEPGRSVTRVTRSERKKVQVKEVNRGDVISVTTGESLPVDGTIVQGEALVNQQTVTGEALPIERRLGDAVFAATIVEAGEIDVRVDRVGLETTVGRIVQAVEAASRQKSEIQRFAERLADRDVGRTLILAGLGAGFARSLDAATAIMVADYGLAARVGIPTSILASINGASRAGILIKGPSALETLARVDTVVFDKTGTLTSGTPRVARVISYRRGLDERDLVQLVASAEHGFSHPVARAVARLAGEWRIAAAPPTTSSERTGLGVDVRIDGRQVLVGSRRFMESREIDLEAAVADEAAAHAVGAAPTFVAIEDRLAGIFILEDELRPEAPSAVRALRARRMRNVIMLSGDHPEPSRVIAESLGLRHHYADLLPEDKARLIRELKAESRVVAMVGDGVNDALALKEADVGIAVPGGAPLATEVADVVLLGGGLDSVVRALDLSSQAVAGIRTTLQVASRANLAVVGLASFGWTRPVVSILLSHGTTVLAAIVAVARQEGLLARASSPAIPPP